MDPCLQNAGTWGNWFDGERGFGLLLTVNETFFTVTGRFCYEVVTGIYYVGRNSHNFGTCLCACKRTFSSFLGMHAGRGTYNGRSYADGRGDKKEQVERSSGKIGRINRHQKSKAKAQNDDIQLKVPNEQETGNSNLGWFDYHPDDDNLSSGKAVGTSAGGCRRTARDFRRDRLDAWLRHYRSGL